MCFKSAGGTCFFYRDILVICLVVVLKFITVFSIHLVFIFKHYDRIDLYTFFSNFEKSVYD